MQEGRELYELVVKMARSLSPGERRRLIAELREERRTDGKADSKEKLRGFLRGIDTTVERDGDRV